ERIEAETDIRNTTKLAEIVEVSLSAIYQARKENKFHLDWAYLVSMKYKLNFEWLTQGRGPAQFDDTERKQIELDFLIDIEEWINSEKKKEPDYLPWFRLEFSRKFPEFKAWKEKKDSESSEDTSVQQVNVA
ncbi:MAG: hypothetical protein KQH63_20340, partial [Desulfobulbaceae bacterium]|nr:hypothetical protein [Desulfobulbaceae bacterium]